MLTFFTKLDHAIKFSWQENRLICFIIFLYIVLAMLTSTLFNFAIDLRIYHRTWWISNLLFVVPALLGASVVGIIRSRPKSWTDLLQEHYLRGSILSQRAVVALPIIALFPLLFSTFTSMKHSLFIINPFLLDPYLIFIEQYVHGGQPWALLHPFLGHHAVTFLLDIGYTAWFFVIFSVLTAVSGWIERPLLRKQYLISFALCWIMLGTVFATLFASVGPCYYGHFFPTEPNPFHPLMEYLEIASVSRPLIAPVAQEMLLTSYMDPEPGLGKGISAFPSLHVAITALNTIVAWKIARFVGIVATAYLVLIMLGSVHLGWHYAVDGYFSVVAVMVIWKASGMIVRTKAQRMPVAVWSRKLK